MTNTETHLQQLTTATTGMYSRASTADTAEAAFGLMELVEAADRVRAATELAVEAMRSNGASWTRVGAALGTTRQAAWEKYGKPAAPANPDFHRNEDGFWPADDL